MEWACQRCGRTHEAPPADGCLACGRRAVVPAGEDGRRDSRNAFLGRVRDAVFAPDELAVDLTNAGGVTSVAFLAIVVVSALFVLAVVLAALL